MDGMNLAELAYIKSLNDYIKELEHKILLDKIEQLEKELAELKKETGK